MRLIKTLFVVENIIKIRLVKELLFQIFFTTFTSGWYFEIVLPEEKHEKGTFYRQNASELVLKSCLQNFSTLFYFKFRYQDFVLVFITVNIINHQKLYLKYNLKLDIFCFSVFNLIRLLLFG